LSSESVPSREESIVEFGHVPRMPVEPEAWNPELSGAAPGRALPRSGELDGGGRPLQMSIRSRAQPSGPW
jgi:hypothetical protein